MKDIFRQGIGKLYKLTTPSPQNNLDTKTLKEIEEAKILLWDYFNKSETEIEKLQAAESELYSNYSVLMDKFQKRGIMLQLHGYSSNFIRWNDNIPMDYLESELEGRQQTGFWMKPGYLHIANLEADLRIIENWADMDLEEIATYRRFKSEGLDNLSNFLYSGMNPGIKKHIDQGTTPRRNDLIKYYCFNSERYGSKKQE